MTRATRSALVLAVLVAAAAVVGSTATSGLARTTRVATTGPLTGTWSGTLSGTYNGKTRTEKITVIVNAAETGGSWSVNSKCHGGFPLNSISGGYHHYLRHVAAGSNPTCLGGDIDCLKRVGANVYDSVTPRAGGWGRYGTLYPVKST